MAFLRLIRNVLVVIILAATAALAWSYYRPLPQPAPVLSFTHEVIASTNKRHVEHITLHTASLGDIGFTLSLPDPLPPGKFPLVMILGGLDSGEHNMQNIGEAGNNIIAGYDWPIPMDSPNGPEFLLQVPKFYSHAMIVPAQIATAIRWLGMQPATDEKRISILGYSMGALAAPTAQDLSQDTGYSIGWTIIAYGGAPLGAIVLADQHIKPEWMRFVLAALATIMFHPLDPDVHLPKLLGDFLILEGKNDQLMPEAARARLREAVPDPKAIVVFEGDHMGVGPDKAELLNKIIAASREWLTHKEAVNPL